MIGWTSHIFGRVIKISKTVFLEGAANTWLEVWCVSAPCDITGQVSETSRHTDGLASLVYVVV